MIDIEEIYQMSQRSTGEDEADLNIREPEPVNSPDL